MNLTTPDLRIDLEHRRAAHCENGVAANLFRHHGLEIDEPLIFGIGSGLFFGHVPFLKVNGTPGTTFRIFPGMIFSRAAKRLGVGMEKQSFRNKEKAMRSLDRNLEEGRPVGLVTSVFFLPYLPPTFRFHFNAHNILVYGKENGEYLVSDPVMEAPTRILREDLQKARFAKGTMAPKGRMYFPVQMPDSYDYRRPVVQGIQQTAKDMTSIPVHYFGVKGIRFLARQMQKWPRKVGDRRATLYLGNVIRMQEEIGTGGAGFRFLYAAFLQQASEILGMEQLKECSEKMTGIGERWRDFTTQAGRLCKKRSSSDVSYDLLAEKLRHIADQEEELFRELRAMPLKK